MKGILLALLLGVGTLLPAAGQFGATARNQAGDSPRANDHSEYVEIPPDIPPETYFTMTYNPDTPLSGIPGWYDVRQGDGFANDFKREFTVSFQDVKMPFPVAFGLGRKEEKPPFPSPEFVVQGAAELDSRDGKSPDLPYYGYYLTDPISESAMVSVRDILKSYEVRPAEGDTPAEVAYRWSLGWVGQVEPVAMTTSQLFKLPEAVATEDIKYGLLVPFSEGGDHLSSTDSETGKPVYNPRLRALYLHKPDNVKVQLRWEPEDALQVWHSPFKARTDGETYYANGEIPSGQEFIHKDDTNPVFIEAIKPAEAKLIWGIGNKYHAIQIVPVDIAVDANRDGKIKFAGNLGETDAEFDRTSKTAPFRFWVNSDNDGTGEGEETFNAPADSADGDIKSIRDLEDFCRLHLYLGGLHEAVHDGTFQVGLEWRNTMGPNPAIKVYRASEPTGGDEYLKNNNSEYYATLQTATPFKTAMGTVDSGGGFKLPSDFFQSTGSGIPSFGEDHPTRYLLFEGVGEGKGQLVMTIWKGGQKIGEGGSVWVDLVNVRKMYERAKARSNPVDIPNPQDSTSIPALPSVDYVLDPWNNQWDYPSVSWTEAKDYIVFVHGWNTSYEDARVLFAESMFKRLWQRGFKGRFAALYWPTLVGPATFNESEYRAWIFGESLKKYMASLPGDYSKNLVGHSMGNVVGGSALRKGMGVRNYAMIDAAVPASCYDENNTLHQSFGNESPDHDTDAATLALAYKNKLANVGNANIINFFLASDDALDLWRLNQELFRPNVFYALQTGSVVFGYSYWSSGPSGQKLRLMFPIGPTRYLTQMEESLGYAAKSSTLAVGAEGRTGGSLGGAVDLGGAGYENEHSSFWKFNLQKMRVRYDTLMDELGVQRNDQ